MNASFTQRVSLISAVTLVFTIGSANAAAYSWTEILIPSIGPLGMAFGLNDKGQVAVGNAAGTKSGIYANGIFTPLPSPPAGYTVFALGINNSGTIVGGALSPSDPTHEQGFVLVGSTYVFFSRPGWLDTEPRAIANSGLITGFNYNGTYTSPDYSATAGFVYNPNTQTLTDVTTPGPGAVFITQGMNAEGRISGDGRWPGGGRYAFVWQSGALVNGTRQLAPFLARFTLEDGTSARSVNDAGVIVGFTNLSGSTAGFVGNDSRGFQLLIPPGGDATGATVACEGINNLRQVVCFITDAAGNIRDFIGTPDENEQ